MKQSDGMITGCDEWLFDRYEQLRDIHERLEHMTTLEPQAVVGKLAWLVEDVRLMRDRAKEEYDAF